MQPLPENTGRRWTPVEESQILSKSTSKVPLKTIAAQHGRTQGGIRSRLLRIAFTFVSEGKTISEAARLTGLTTTQILAQVQTSEKTDSVPVAPVLPTMNFSSTFSRADLQAIPAKRRLDAIRSYVDHNVDQPLRYAATLGQTSYLFVMPKPNTMVRSHPPAYEVTLADVIEGASAKFPGCKVGFSDEWVDVRPGVREHREGVLIDWS